jgi:hypothetical protein
MFHIPRKGKQLYTTRVYIERDSASRVNVVVITHLQKQQKKPKKEGEKKSSSSLANQIKTAQ